MAVGVVNCVCNVAGLHLLELGLAESQARHSSLLLLLLCCFEVLVVLSVANTDHCNHNIGYVNPSQPGYVDNEV